MEVGCERFFGLSANVSLPRRTRLGVRNYERLTPYTLLSSSIQNVHVDVKWVANKEYGVLAKLQDE